ncbi:MAG: hypothetical protein U1A06_05105 [Hoeflea sp.]|nr:hypothetical protein [Hoeflea sp.]
MKPGFLRITVGAAEAVTAGFGEPAAAGAVAAAVPAAAASVATPGAAVSATIAGVGTPDTATVAARGAASSSEAVWHPPARIATRATNAGRFIGIMTMYIPVSTKWWS